MKTLPPLSRHLIFGLSEYENPCLLVLVQGIRNPVEQKRRTTFGVFSDAVAGENIMRVFKFFLKRNVNRFSLNAIVDARLRRRHEMIF